MPDCIKCASEINEVENRNISMKFILEIKTYFEKKYFAKKYFKITERNSAKKYSE